MRRARQHKGEAMATEQLMNNQQILARLRELLADKFEVDPARITPEADLYRDLDLDSIDAVDLVIKLQEMTGKRIKPDEFKSVRTIGDVVVAVERLIEV